MRKLVSINLNKTKKITLYYILIKWKPERQKRPSIRRPQPISTPRGETLRKVIYIKLNVANATDEQAIKRNIHHNITWNDKVCIFKRSCI